MNYPDLKDFILKKMRMSHIYRPVMILTLLQAKGECSEEEIAKGSNIARGLISRLNRSKTVKT